MLTEQLNCDFAHGDVSQAHCTLRCHGCAHAWRRVSVRGEDMEERFVLQRDERFESVRVRSFGGLEAHKSRVES